MSGDNYKGYWISPNGENHGTNSQAGDTWHIPKYGEQNRVKELELENEDLRASLNVACDIVGCDRAHHMVMLGKLHTLIADNKTLKEKYLKAQSAIKRLLVTYARRLEGNWYEATAEECGLKLDSMGFIKDIDSNPPWKF